jgi:DNA-binding NarL/FixJ family response regulator
MKQKTNLFLVDDNPQFRIGLKIYLETFEHFSICGEASNGEDGLQQILKLRPCIAIIDLCMPQVDGAELIKRLHTAESKSKIIVLSQQITSDWLNKIIENGIDGHILKSDGRDFLINAIEAVQADSKYFSPSVAKSFYEMLTSNKSLKKNKLVSNPLSPREEKIAFLASKGLTVNEIAQTLGCSENTIKTHKSNLMRKIQARNTAEVSCWVYEKLF